MKIFFRIVGRFLVKYITERIDYWAKEEKKRGIPNPYN